MPKLNIGIYSKFDQYYTYNIIMYDFFHIIPFLIPIWSWISKMMQENVSPADMIFFNCDKFSTVLSSTITLAFSLKCLDTYIITSHNIPAIVYRAFEFSPTWLRAFCYWTSCPHIFLLYDCSSQLFLY